MSTAVEATVIERPAAIVKAAEETRLPPARQNDLIQAFAPSFCAAIAIVDKSKSLTVTDATQVSEMKEARQHRLDLRRVRLDTDKLRKEMKQEYLDTAKGIENVAQAVIRACESEEARLEECEKFAERAEAARREANRKSREALLAPYNTNTQYMDLGAMPDDVFAALLNTERQAHANRLAEAKRAEEERIKAEKERAAEAERQRLENERLRREREELEAKARREREELEAKARKEREEAQAERNRIEAEAREERQRLEAQAAQERAKADELRRQAEQERQAREAKERAAREEQARKDAEEAAAKRAAELAPDADKVRALIDAFNAVTLPECSTEEGRKAVLMVGEWRSRFVNAIRGLAEGLV